MKQSGRIAFVSFILISSFTVSCWAGKKAVAPAINSAASKSESAQATTNRPKFATRKVKIGATSISVEVADDDVKRAHGLMFRERLDENTGMIFIFDQPRVQTFWMKNTLIPLSIAFIGQDLTIVDIQEMEPASAVELSPRLYTSSAPAKYALEMNKGWFAKHHVKTGEKIAFP